MTRKFWNWVRNEEPDRMNCMQAMETSPSGSTLRAVMFLLLHRSTTC